MTTVTKWILRLKAEPTLFWGQKGPRFGYLARERAVVFESDQASLPASHALEEWLPADTPAPALRAIANVAKEDLGRACLQPHVVRAQETLRGRIFRVGGAEQDPQVHFETRLDGVVHAMCTQEVAKEAAALLYEPADLDVDTMRDAADAKLVGARLLGVHRLAADGLAAWSAWFAQANPTRRDDD